MKRLARATVLVPVAVAALAIAATPAGAASDSRIAKAGVIRPNDVPGWAGAPQDESGNKLALKAATKVRDCKGYVVFTKANKSTPNASSLDFELGDQSISNKSFVYPNVAAAKKSMKSIGGSTVADCLTDVFQTVFDAQMADDPETAAQIDSARMQIDPVTSLPSVGDDAVGYAGGLEITKKDATVEQLLTGVLVVRVGRAINSYSFSAPPSSTEITSALDQAIVATLERTEAALD